MLKLKGLFAFLTVLGFLTAKAQVYKIAAGYKTSATTVPIDNMFGSNEKGISLTVNNKYFVKNNQPWFPLMGELHYNRVPAKDWETEILKMKSAGLSIVATYVFWNEHETARNIWDWKNNCNLRRFVSLCAKNNLYVWLRIGPWSHGEQLNGGFPNWIQSMKNNRTNNATYISEAAKLYQQIGEQTKGLYFKNGGPIIGCQLENEYASGQAAHISKLKEMALNAHINPVYWTVTANTLFDDKKMEVIPLQGSYPYRGWENAGGNATKDFLYGNDQWIMSDALGKVFYDVNKFPKGMCEQGSGSQLTFNNRFIVEPHVVEAHLQNQIGRGMNEIGYYMFHGGTQTPGLKEPDCPESYDFQAPVGEFGLLRPSYRYLKILHHFINDFGGDLAKMQVYEPENPVRNEKDTANLRYIVRADKTSGNGFLFLGNTQVRISMPDKNVIMKVNLPDETITFPSILLKGQTTAILPFNLQIGTALLKYATAQPMAKLNYNKHTTLFFQQLPGVVVQLAFKTSGIILPKATGWQTETKGDQTLFKSTGKTDLTLTDKSGHTISLIFLTRKQAENSWRTQLKNQEVLIIADADLLFENKQIIAQQLEQPNFNLSVYPKGLNAIANSMQDKKNTLFDHYEIQSPVYRPKLVISYPQPKNAIINLPPTWPKNVSDIVLNVDYLGDYCKLLQHNQYITDNLFNGTTWQIGLHRFIGSRQIDLELQDWNNKTTGVPLALVNEIKAKGVHFKQIKAVPQYQTIFKLNL